MRDARSRRLPLSRNAAAQHGCRRWSPYRFPQIIRNLTPNHESPQNDGMQAACLTSPDSQIQSWVD